MDAPEQGPELDAVLWRDLFIKLPRRSLFAGRSGDISAGPSQPADDAGTAAVK